MAKVHVLLFVVAVLPILNGYPLLEEDTSSVATDSSNDHTQHNLKVNPLVDGQNEQENNEDVTKSNENTPKKEEDSTDSSYIEETYIEVLLPGTPQINSSVLESLLVPTTNTTDADRPKRGATDSPSPSQKEEQIGSSTSRPLVVPVPYSEQAIQTRLVRDSYSEKNDESKTDSSEEKSKATGEDSTQSHGSTLRPVLYAKVKSAQNVKRERDSEEDTSSSDGRSSEKQQNESHISTGLLSSSPASTPQSSNSRVVRNTSNKQNEYKHEPAQSLAISGSDLEKERHESSSSGSPVVKEKASTASRPIISAQPATQTRRVRDSSSKKDDESEEASSKPAGVLLIQSHSSTIRPTLYSSANGAQNLKRQADSKKDISTADEGSLVKKENKPHILSNYAAVTPQSSNSPVVRNTVNKQIGNQNAKVSAAPERNIEKPTYDASSSSSLPAVTLKQLPQSQRDTIRPVLYSSGAQNVKRGIESKEDISSLKKVSLEDRENKPHTATGILPSSPILSAQGSKSQVAITNIADKQNTNENDPQHSATPDRNIEKGTSSSSLSSSLSAKEGQLGYSTTGRPVIVPIPYSQQAVHARPVREACSEEDDDSKEKLSEEKSKPSIEGLTQGQITNGTSPQVSKTRVVRKASDAQNVNKHSSPQVYATSGSNSDKTKYESSSEPVVFVTPQAKGLN